MNLPIVATNIRLPEKILKELKYKAIEEKKSVNQLVREAIERYLSMDEQMKETGTDPFEKIIGSVRSGVKDGSIRHNEYLYRKKK